MFEGDEGFGIAIIAQDRASRDIDLDDSSFDAWCVARDVLAFLYIDSIYMICHNIVVVKFFYTEFEKYFVIAESGYLYGHSPL